MSKQSIQRTTITVPTVLANDLKKMVNAPTKTEAVVLAITEEIRRRKLGLIRNLAGKINFTASTVGGRHADHRLG